MKKSKVLEYFRTLSDNGRTTYVCLFCDSVYTCKNVTRFVRHMVFNCTSSPVEVKRELGKKEPKEINPSGVSDEPISVDSVTADTFNEISAQDNNNATETQTQLCCPCPPGWPGAVVPSPVRPGSTPGPVDPVARSADGVDDCPCRARDADSEGAASVFSPNAVRAFGDVVRPDPKEDPKPLLHPEVDLASSVLETLREATDEEYRDALERDAARAAVEVASISNVITEGVPEEDRKVVTIIVSPRDMDGSDDTMPEASHAQETRCIHSSLGNPRASFTYRAPVPRKGLEDILNLPLPNGLLHRQRDSNLVASNVHESVVRADDNLNKFLSGLRLKTEPSLLKLDPKIITEKINNVLSGTGLGNKAGKIDLDASKIDSSNVETELSNDHFSSEVVEETDNISTVLNESDSTRQSGGQDDLNCNTSPTNDQEIVLEKSAKNTGPLKSLLFARNNKETSQVAFPLKNLFKLKDVELVPLDILKNKPKAKISIPSIKLNTLLNTEVREPTKVQPQSILFGKPSKFITENPETGLNKLNKAKTDNIQTIPKRKSVTTEILDAVPSPSDDNCVRLKPEADKSAGVNMEELEDSLLNSSFEKVKTNDEKTTDITEIDTDISDINSAEQVQLKRSEILNEESNDTEDFQIIDDTQVPVQESDSDIQIISEEDNSDVPLGSIDLSEINGAEDRSNSIHETPHPLRTLDEIKKNVVDKLKALEKTNRNALDNIKHNVEEMSTQVEERNHDTDFVQNENLSSNVEATFESLSPTTPIQEELEDLSASAESISIQDLQKMSDSILLASENQEQRADATNDASLVESAENNSASEEISEGEIDNVLGMDGKEREPSNNLDQSTDASDSLKTACPSDAFKKAGHNKLENSNNTENKNTGDLETLASDPIMDIFRPTSLTNEPIINILRPNSRSLVDHINDLGTKLRQSIVVQPSSLINANDFNIFRTPSLNIPDISVLSANIPTLEEIRTRVSEILDGLARTASDDDESCEIDSDDFASDDNPVVSSASSPDPISVLPSLKRLEDINFDIIQLKPLPSILGSSPLTSNLPGLSLNRYKAKLAIPKSLDIKPLNLASTLGTNGGLVGTTLTIGPEKKGKTIKPKFKSKNNAEFGKSSRVALKNNPTLADITSTIHKNALNLLNIPKSSKRPNLQASNGIDHLAEKIKSHTEGTVRSIHEALNPSSLSDINNNVLKNANHLLASGRNSMQKTLQTSTPIESAVDNLRSQTQNTIQQLHSTLHSPRVADLNSVIQKNTYSILKSPENSINAAVDNLRAQSENTFRNIQQTLDTTPLPDLRNCIHKTAENLLKSTTATTPTKNLLGSSMQVIPPIDEVASKLRSHTQNALKNIQQTLSAPTLSDVGTSIQKNVQVLKSPIKHSRPQILKSALSPSTSIDTVVDNLRSQTQNTMRTIQNSLNTPTLADISATVQKHAQNLLDSPVALTGQDAFKQVLQASPPISLTTHAEQVAKDLHKTLKATLKNNPIKDLPPLPHPNDVIQIISDHHEDFNDKLHALHTDLTDRLESIHNEVTDPERLRSILSPPGNRNFELFAIPLPMSSRSASSALKQARPTLQAKQSSVKLASQKKQPKSSAASRSRTETAKPNSMRASITKDSSAPKSFRIPSAASSPVPTRIDRPTLSLTSKRPFKGLEDIKKPVLPKFKPLAKNKVTITFGSTTQRPTPVGKSDRAVPTTAKPKVSTDKRFKPKGPIRQPTPWNGWGEERSAPKRLGDPLTSPSQITPNARTPLKSKTSKPNNSPVKTEISSRLSPVTPKIKLQSVQPSKSKFKSTPLTQGRASISSRSKLDPLNKRKSPLLTKLTDAIKNKQTHALSQTPRTKPREMTPAASDRFEKVVALEEPLKENVPYKCKMMCVKVDLNDE